MKNPRRNRHQERVRGRPVARGGLLPAAVAMAAIAAAAAAPPPSPAPFLRVPLWTATGAAPDREPLRVLVEGSQARVAGMRGPKDALLLIVVLDLAGDLALVDLAKRALASEIEKLPPNVWMALMRAQDGLRVMLDPTRDRARLLAAVREVTASGNSGLLDTVETTAHLADSILLKADVRLAVLYLTDSNIYNYRDDYTNPVINRSDDRDLSRRFPEGLVNEKISRLETSLSAFQAPFFFVHLDYRSDRLNEAYQSGLMKLAETTGGTATVCRSSADIAPGIEKTIAQIGALHFLTIELPEGNLKSVQVQLDSGGQSLTYRSRFARKGGR